MAYNKTAAEDMGSRISERLSKALGYTVEIEARTFHSMGKSLLGDAPDGHRWQVIPLDTKEGARIFLEALNGLLGRDEDENEDFRQALFEWLALGQHPEPTVEPASGEIEEHERRYEAACRNQLRQKIERKLWEPTIPTYDPTVYVRSLEERAIANWLWIRGVKFDYEKWAPDDIASRVYGTPDGEKPPPYKPDFSYPPPAPRKARIFHEHFGIGKNGQAPEFLGGKRYVDQACGKRRAFLDKFERLAKARQPIPFFETTSGQYRDGSIFEVLERELLLRGVPVGPVDLKRRDDALRQFSEAPTTKSLFLEFIQGFRESGQSRKEVLDRALKSPEPYRAILFLRVAFRLLDEIERLFGGHIIEFCDMLSKGAAAARAGGGRERYKLILVDEFQDTSRLRMELIDALAGQIADDCVLFFVGDDWQAINRFAGADIRHFHAYVPETAWQPGAHAVADHHGVRRYNRSTHLVWLAKTFRCPQGIADVARRTVLGAAGALDKGVTSDIAATHGVVKIVEHLDDGASRTNALRRELKEIAQLPCPHDDNNQVRLFTVFLLTRNMDDAFVPEGLEEARVAELQSEFADRLVIKRSTMHSTKGLEADFVIIAGMDTGYKGFPNLWDTDPLLELVLPEMDDPADEERRLFYVALTRAKRKTILLAAGNRPSRFILELEGMEDIQDRIEWQRIDVEREICPSCGQGSLRLISNKTRVGCSRYPRCGFNAKQKKFPHVGRRRETEPEP